MSARNVPVIDIKHLRDRATLDALDSACREWGFFQVVNHGIAQETIAGLLSQAHAFFAESASVKREIMRTAENPWGFYDRELTKNTLDWKQIYDYGPANGDAMCPQWPRTLPAFRPALLEYYRACEVLAFRLLGAVSVNLGMPEEYLAASFRPAHTSFLRLNYYPKCPKPERPDDIRTPREGHLGLNHHTDAGALTLLLQDDQPGLEVYRQGRWHLVEPRRDALVINVGDIVQVWSNDRYTAALHRVLANSEAERFSIPYFMSPAYSTDYAPLPSTIVGGHGPRYRAINWGDFYAKRTAGDYADIGEEVQISHYQA